MKNIRGIFLFMYSIDKGIYGEKITPNRFFGTLSVLTAMLIGMMYHIVQEELFYDFDLGGGSYIDLDWTEYNTLIVNSFISLACLWAFNVAESIIASKRSWIPLARSGMLGGIFLLFYFIARELPSVVVIVLVALWTIGIVVTEIVAAVTKSAVDEGDYEYEVPGSLNPQDYNPFGNTIKNAVDDVKPLESPRFCPHCGALLESDHLFCGQCGQRL